ncbi:MAG: PIN domain-containing protein [Flavipsychrobacter sp.]
MSYKLKTLIVFDTNSLRSTEAGEVAYSFFSFGRPYQVVEGFIAEKNLTDEIHIAIPKWAIEELKDQKQRQYNEDIAEFQKLATRLNGLPHMPALAIQEDAFDCKEYVETKAEEFIATKEIKLLEIKEETANSVLHSMMARVIKEEGRKAPFANSGKYKDAGFKDNIVWESLMNFDEVANYDKIIFLTKDGDYNRHCEDEFRSKWTKHITIIKDENNVVATLQKDYDNYIKERVIHDFAQTEYFKDYLKAELNSKTTITIDGIDHKIENYTIVDYCDKVERFPNEELEIENIFIFSTVKIHYTDNNGTKQKHEVIINTVLEDEDTKEFIATEYNTELT